MSRVLLKLSGEALSGDKGNGFDEATCAGVAAQIRKLADAGTQTAIVIGGGNFWRGRTSGDMDRCLADQIGMMATVMNCIYMSDHLRRQGLSTKIMTPFACGAFTELFSVDRANDSLSDGQIVFFAGGTGHPYFSTDTATVLRALEIKADCILLAKAIDGVYDKDPARYEDAKRYDRISIEQVVEEKLAVVDLTASIMCMENRMPMAVFSLREEESILRSVPVNGEFRKNFNGTIVSV